MIVFKIYQVARKCGDKIYGIQSLVEAVMFAITSGDGLLADIPPLMRMTCTFTCQIDRIGDTTGPQDSMITIHVTIHMYITFHLVKPKLDACTRPHTTSWLK